MLSIAAPSPACALRPMMDQAGLEEALKPAAGLEEPDRVHTVAIEPGQPVSRADLSAWEVEAVLPQAVQILGELFPEEPPRVVWSVGGPAAVAGALPGRRVVVFEQDAERISAARAAFASDPERLTLVTQSFLEYLPPGDQRPDAVVVADLLEGMEVWERYYALDTLFNMLKPGGRLLVLLRSPAGDHRSGLIRAVWGEAPHPSDTGEIPQFLAMRGDLVDIRSGTVRLELRGTPEQIGAAALLLLPPGADAEKVRQYLGESAAPGFTADHLIVSGTKRDIDSSLKVPVRLEGLLVHMLPGQREVLYRAMTDPDVSSDEARIREVLKVIGQNEHYQHRMGPDEQRALMEEIVTRTGTGPLSFVNREGVVALLTREVGGLSAGARVSVDRANTFTGEASISDTLREVRACRELLTSEEQSLLDALFRRVFFEGEDQVSENDSGTASLLFRGVFGHVGEQQTLFEGATSALTPELQRIVRAIVEHRGQARMFSVRDLVERYPGVDGVLLREERIPQSIARRVRAPSGPKGPRLAMGAELTLSEIGGILGFHRARPENHAPLPRSLMFWRDRLREAPVPRLVRLLPDLQDPAALWDPLQLELLEGYARTQMEISFVDAGQEFPPQPAWGWDSGGRGGAADFGLPEENERRLAEARTFTERVLLLAEFLGWTDEQLTQTAGVGPEVIRSWRRQGTPEPRDVRNVSAFAAAVRAHPLYLLTGKPAGESMRRDAEGNVMDSVGERMKLWLKASGMTQQQAADKLGVDLTNVGRLLSNKEWRRRDILQEWCRSLLGQPPCLLETGWEPTRPLFSSSEQSGFKSGRAASALGIQAFAPLLQEALVRRWKRARGKTVASAWEQEIARDPEYAYPGLAIRLLWVYPGTIRRMAHYGMIPPEAEEMLLRWNDRLVGEPLPGPEEMARMAGTLAGALAGPLAQAHDELEELFETAPAYRPPGGYLNSKRGNARAQHAWDLIARGLCRAQILALADETDLPLGKFLSRVLSSASPEQMVTVVLRPERIQALQERFPGLPANVIRNYLASPGGAAEALEEAFRVVRPRLVDLSGRGWIRPVTPNGDATTPESFAGWVLNRSVYPGRSLLARFDRRNRVLQAALLELGATLLSSLGRVTDLLEESASGGGWAMQGLRAEGEEGDPSDNRQFLAARDLLHRAVAYRQAADPAFLREPSPEAAQRLIEETVQFLDQAAARDELPGSGEEFEMFLARMGASFTAGLEEAVQLLRGMRNGKWVPLLDYLGQSQTGILQRLISQPRETVEANWDEWRRNKATRLKPADRNPLLLDINRALQRAKQEEEKRAREAASPARPPAAAPPAAVQGAEDYESSMGRLEETLAEEWGPAAARLARGDRTTILLSPPESLDRLVQLYADALEIPPGDPSRARVAGRLAPWVGRTRQGLTPRMRDPAFLGAWRSLWDGPGSLEDLRGRFGPLEEAIRRISRSSEFPEAGRGLARLVEPSEYTEQQRQTLREAAAQVAGCFFPGPGNAGPREALSRELYEATTPASLRSMLDMHQRVLGDVGFDPGSLKASFRGSVETAMRHPVFTSRMGYRDRSGQVQNRSYVVISPAFAHSAPELAAGAAHEYGHYGLNKVGPAWWHPQGGIAAVVPADRITQALQMVVREQATSRAGGDLSDVGDAAEVGPVATAFLYRRGRQLAMEPTARWASEMEGLDFFTPAAREYARGILMGGLARGTAQEIVRASAGASVDPYETALEMIGAYALQARDASFSEMTRVARLFRVGKGLPAEPAAGLEEKIDIPSIFPSLGVGERLALEEVWQQVARVGNGDWETIRAMSFEEFAERMGAVSVDWPAGPEVIPIVYISERGYRGIQEKRGDIALARQAEMEYRSPEQGRGLLPQWWEAPEIAGEGVYWFPREMERYRASLGRTVSKNAVFHEFMERFLMRHGIEDGNFQVLGHATPAVIMGDLMFAARMGEGAFERAVADHRADLALKGQGPAVGFDRRFFSAQRREKMLLEVDGKIYEKWGEALWGRASRRQRMEDFVRQERGGFLGAEGRLPLGAEAARRLSGNAASSGGVIVRLPPAFSGAAGSSVFAQEQIIAHISPGVRDSVPLIGLPGERVAGDSGARAVAILLREGQARGGPDGRDLVLLERHADFPADAGTWEMALAAEGIAAGNRPRIVAVDAWEADGLTAQVLGWLRTDPSLADFMDLTLAEMVRDEQGNWYAVATWA